MHGRQSVKHVKTDWNAEDIKVLTWTVSGAARDKRTYGLSVGG